MRKQKIQSKDVVETIPTVPKLTVGSFLLKVVQNVQNWVEVYAWLPVSFLSIYFMSLSAYFLTGRAPQMNMDFMPELAVNLFKVVCAVALTSVAKQAWFGWLTVDQKLANQSFALGRMVFEVSIFFSIMYVLFNK